MLTRSNQELGRDEDSETESIKKASTAVEVVAREARIAQEVRRLEDVKAQLLAALDEPDQTLIRKCGELLRFENTATTSTVYVNKKENVRILSVSLPLASSQLLTSWCYSH
jgi:hypothetical protein